MASTSSTTASRLGWVTSLVGGGGRSSSQARRNARRPLLGRRRTRSPRNAFPYRGIVAWDWFPRACVEGCLGRLLAAARRRVDARDTAVRDVLGPFGSRPVALLVPARRVDQPTGGDPGEGDPAGRLAVEIRRLRGGGGRGARRPEGPPLARPATTRREGPHREEGEEDDQEEPGAMTVEVRDCSLLAGTWCVGSGWGARRRPIRAVRSMAVQRPAVRAHLVGPAGGIAALRFLSAASSSQARHSSGAPRRSALPSSVSTQGRSRQGGWCRTC